MKYVNRAIAMIACICCAAAGVGCGSSGPEPRQAGVAGLPTPAGETYSPTATWPKIDGGAVTRYIRLQVGEDIARTCGITKTHFEFDSAEPLPQDVGAVEAIAACLIRPELNTLPVELVGRADTRGAPDYNLDLGRQRADRVKQILVSEGVPEARISTASRGEADAVGDAKAVSGYSQGYDRRVDVMVKGTPHAPE